jgi:hypothetical protein
MDAEAKKLAAKGINKNGKNAFKKAATTIKVVHAMTMKNIPSKPITTPTTSNIPVHAPATKNII